MTQRNADAQMGDLGKAAMEKAGENVDTLKSIQSVLGG